jgi:hypothetical protein
MKKMMPPAVPMSTASAPAVDAGTSGPVAPQAKPAFAPAAKFNPDNQLAPTAMHKGRGFKK